MGCYAVGALRMCAAATAAATDIMNKRQQSCDTFNIYHEKQVKELCALHALNNLFQEENTFTKQVLDEICFNLSPDHIVNPHKSVLGLGNYDVNVIMAALQMNGCETIWFDKRRSIDCLIFKNVKGFILNIPTDYKWGIFRLPLKRKHWICLREICGLYYNLDSKLDLPELIGREPELRRYLQEQINAKDKELILVVNRDVERNKTWRIPDPEFSTPRKSNKHGAAPATAGGGTAADGTPQRRRHDSASQQQYRHGDHSATAIDA
ncbi:PREDICTED: josephin-1-like [Priapulus caudatus]|uniref:ubiquitinyl hydrolase 1 n=1 Tax=Priapulus caudatus TaxID=37621 RepID=A0ABM1DT97_PRICU|nr:PREDICTED: josephin-1-like [Priapulus caudatus]